MLLGSREVQANPELAAQIEEFLLPENFLAAASRMPWRRGETPLALSPALEDSAFGFYFEHDAYSDWWRTPSLAMDEWFDRYPAIPILWITGWWEVYARSVVDGWRRMVELGRPHQHLLAGPWTHHNFTPWNGDANYGADATLDSLDLKRRWFDRFLKGDESVDVGPPVQLFAMGGGDLGRGEDGRRNVGGRWLVAEHLDALEARRLRLHLHEGGTLAEEPPAAAESSTTYVFDPGSTLHSDGRCEIAYGPAAELGFSGMGPYDQVQLATLPGHGTPGRPTRERDDVLVFETEPLAADVTVAGTVAAVVHLSSDAPDTDVFVKVIDVAPDGYAFPVTDGILRARFRESLEHPTPLAPAEVHRLALPLHPVAHTFAAGHRLRVDVASSSFPSYDVNPYRATNTIHHDAVRASYVELSVTDR
jgi:predicted acyl esterase